MKNLDASKADWVGLAQAIHQAVIDLRSIDRESRNRWVMWAFLPGEREIRDVSHFLRQASIDRLDVLPLYARLGARNKNL